MQERKAKTTPGSCNFEKSTLKNVYKHIEYRLCFVLK